MGEEVFIVAIVFGSVLSIVFLGIVGSIIKAWIKRGSGGNLSENKEFLAALREFKEKTEKRLENLETIVTDDSPRKNATSQKKQETKRAKSSLEIEMDDEPENNSPNEGSRLKNMLNS
ncbi:MAG: hypothetical protein JJU37_04875 [Balneolaceae bacterium]|nr:hypothetical protein [Balneolaceae bacterium]